MASNYRWLEFVNTEDIPRLNWIWSNLRSQETAFDDFTRNRPEIFLSIITEPSSHHAVAGEAALLSARGAYEKSNCNVHIALWDRKVSFTDLIAACVEFLGFLFDEIRVNRATAYIPIYNKPAVRLITLLGFKYEGCMRKTTLFNGEFYDTNFYGMLRQEWEKTKLLNKVDSHAFV